MEHMSFIEKIGVLGSVGLPLWNIPLIINICKRRSSADLSTGWLLGVWVCSLLMLPNGITSQDMVLKLFSIVNITLFSGVVIVAFKYRQKK